VEQVGGAAVQGWGGHVLLLYVNEHHRLTTLAGWVRSGLDRGDKVLYPEAPGDRDFVRGLAECGLDVAEAADRGQLTGLPLGEYYPEEGQAVLVDTALDEGYAAVRFSAEAGLARSHLSEDRYLTVERDIEELCTTRPVSAMCQYDAGRTRLDELVGAMGSHPRLVDHDELRLDQRPGRIVLEGEASLVSSDMLEVALECACAASRVGSLSVDLSGLDFIDVAACRALMLGSATLRESGGHLYLERPRPPVRRTLRLLGVERLDGVVLVP
jgi:anti-anti-sigma factor